MLFLFHSKKVKMLLIFSHKCHVTSELLENKNKKFLAMFSVERHLFRKVWEIRTTTDRFICLQWNGEWPILSLCHTHTLAHTLSLSNTHIHTHLCWVRLCLSIIFDQVGKKDGWHANWNISSMLKQSFLSHGNSYQ